MKRTGTFLILAAAGLLTVGCAGKKNTQTTMADLQAEVEAKSQKIEKLESSMQSLETDLGRSKAEAEAKAAAALKAEKLAKEAEERAKVAERGASGSTTASMGGTELFPPNAKPGECYARVFVPPTYDTATERVLKNGASERIETIPAKYEWTTERVMVKPAGKRLEKFDAKYEWQEERVLVEPAHTVWKKGRGAIERVDNGTGEIMCLVEVPAAYKTVRKKVQTSAPGTREIEIPAEYKTIKVQKLVEAAKERRIPIAEEWTTVTKKNMVTEGKMAWREILCETNMSRTNVMSIQRSLQKAGHNPGPIDGVFGSQTSAAVRSFQKANGLPTGGLTLNTIKKLGVNI